MLDNLQKWEWDSEMVDWFRHRASTLRYGASTGRSLLAVFGVGPSVELYVCGVPVMDGPLSRPKEVE